MLTVELVYPCMLYANCQCSAKPTCLLYDVAPHDVKMWHVCSNSRIDSGVLVFAKSFKLLN